MDNFKDSMKITFIIEHTIGNEKLVTNVSMEKESISLQDVVYNMIRVAEGAGFGVTKLSKLLEEEGYLE
jgi:hypothetical protein